MTSGITQYLNDHANAGQCAAAYYNGTHDTGQCRTPAGVCSVIAYLIVEIKNAEQAAAVARENLHTLGTPLGGSGMSGFINCNDIPMSPASSGASIAGTLTYPEGTR